MGSHCSRGALQDERLTRKGDPYRAACRFDRDSAAAASLVGLLHRRGGTLGKAAALRKDPAATTGPNDACAVGKGGLRKQGADRPARRQRQGAWRSSAVLLAHERRTLNRPFAPRVELSLGLCEDLQTTAVARSRRASVAHAAVAVARGDRDLTVAPDENQRSRRARWTAALPRRSASRRTSRARCVGRSAAPTSEAGAATGACEVLAQTRKTVR